MNRSTRINWEGFSKLRDDDTLKIVAAMCKSCKQLLHTPCTRTFESHRRSCKDTALSHAVHCEVINESMEVDDLHKEVRHPTSEIDDVYDKTNLLHRELAKFFFTGGIPFRQIENPYLTSFIRLLRDFNIDYNPPTRSFFGNNVLQQVHDNVLKEKKVILNSTDSVLLVDGWRNKSANKKYLVFSLRNFNTHQTFLSFVDTSTEREDGDNLAAHINDAIDFAKTTYNTNVYCVVTDNDSKIKKGVQLSRTANANKLWQSTCSSHSGNLLLKSLVDPDLMTILRELLGVFKEPKLESLLIRKGGTKLQNYPDTRFGFFRNTCLSILKNLQLLKELCTAGDSYIKKDITDLVSSEELEVSLRKTVDLLNPICILINRCQSPDCNVADSTELWLSLRLSTNEHNTLILNRIKKAISDVVYAANFIHHKYEGQLLNEDQRKIALNFLKTKMTMEEKSELDAYYEKIERYCNYKEKCINPHSYWSLVGSSLPNLSRFCIKLMLIPASTALLEGMFSNWSYVHNIYRNRLGDDKSACLLDVYHFLKHHN